MAVGVISAIPEEYTKLEWDSEPRTEIIVNKIFKFGKMNGIDVIAAECGIGKVNAALTTGLLLGHFGCDSIAFSGVAGGLNPELQQGDIIIADELIQHDYGAIVNGQLISSIPGSFPALDDTDEGVAYVMPGRLKNALVNVIGLEPKFGRILTGDTYLACESTRKMFRGQFGADAIEMEGAAIAQVCCAWHVPFVIVRVLSDLSGAESHLQFEEFIDDASTKAAQTVSKILPILEEWK
jgi:adenosylhomocysteine nucleosidase